MITSFYLLVKLIIILSYILPLYLNFINPIKKTFKDGGREIEKAHFVYVKDRIKSYLVD